MKTWNSGSPARTRGGRRLRSRALRNFGLYPNPVHRRKTDVLVDSQPLFLDRVSSGLPVIPEKRWVLRDCGCVINRKTQCRVRLKTWIVVVRIARASKQRSGKNSVNLFLTQLLYAFSKSRFFLASI